MKLVIIFLFSFGYFFSIPNAEKGHLPTDPTEQEAALEVLVKKCNACHQTQKSNRVFTLDNMKKYAKRINKTVFIKKRMPPENAIITLTEEDKITLKNWLDVELKK